jgi:hypothetical protein
MFKVNSVTILMDKPLKILVRVNRDGKSFPTTITIPAGSRMTSSEHLTEPEMIEVRKAIKTEMDYLHK